VRTALDRAAARITWKFGKQPEIEAAIRDTIGQTYKDLGVYPEARANLERALDLYRQTLGAENPKTLTTMRLLGGTLQLQANTAEAEALLNQTLQIQRRVLGLEHSETMGCMNNLAITYFFEGKYSQAEPLYSQALEMQRRRLGSDHANTLQTMQQSCQHLRASRKIRGIRGPSKPDTGDQAPRPRSGPSPTR